MTDNGVELRDVYVCPEDVLTGSAVWRTKLKTVNWSLHIRRASSEDARNWRGDESYDAVASPEKEDARRSRLRFSALRGRTEASVPASAEKILIGPDIRHQDCNYGC